MNSTSNTAAGGPTFEEFFGAVFADNDAVVTPLPLPLPLPFSLAFLTNPEVDPEVEQRESFVLDDLDDLLGTTSSGGDRQAQPNTAQSATASAALASGSSEVLDDLDDLLGTTSSGGDRQAQPNTAQSAAASAALASDSSEVLLPFPAAALASGSSEVLDDLDDLLGTTSSGGDRQAQPNTAQPATSSGGDRQAQPNTAQPATSSGGDRQAQPNTAQPATSSVASSSAAADAAGEGGRSSRKKRKRNTTPARELRGWAIHFDPTVTKKGDAGERLALVKHAKTVGEYLDLLGNGMKATADFTWDCKHRLLLGPGADAFMDGREYVESKKKVGRPFGSKKK